MLGEEPGPPYNRILVSKLLARTCGRGDLELRPAAWYRENGVDLRGGCPAEALDLEACEVIDRAGRRHGYDALVLATGSRAFVPPIPGAEAPHVLTFRTPADVDALAAAVPRSRSVVVVGGGLLGLEAAAGLLGRGASVTVVEVAPRLMAQQLDAGAAALLERPLRRMGLEFVLGRSVTSIGHRRVTLDDGRELPAQLVVIAAGVRAETSLGRAAGIEVDRGIVVDDQMRTSAPGVLAVGECAEHRGQVYGLWAPLAEQARVAGATVAGDPAAFLGATPATTLKVAGVDVFAGGRPEASPDQDEIVLADTRRGSYRKLVLDGDRLAGALLVGDLTSARELSALLRNGEPVPDQLLEPGGVVTEQSNGPDSLVCSCNAVTSGTIEEAIARGGLTTLAQVSGATRAATGCGSCARDVEALLARSSARNTDEMRLKRAGASMGT
jgi:ferredoxin-nitrate reductase